MDAIDAALLEAWNRVAPAVRGDRMEAVRRAGRDLRPVRAWCLCFRASDTRINPRTAIMLKDPYWARQSHHLVVSSALVRELCRPVELPFEGTPLIDAAAMLGRSQHALRYARRRGILKARRLKMAGSGPPRVKLWSPTALDPNSPNLAAPDSIWGTLWHYLHERLPDNIDYHLHRVPELQPRRHRQEFRGWRFTCPGLPPSLREGQGRASLPTCAQPAGRSSDDPDALATYSPTCGRRTETLYIPLKPWTLPDAFGIANPLASVLPSLREGQGRADSPSTSFLPACRHCHRIRFVSLVDPAGWTQFVACMSGGLLYGHEVALPRGLEIRRKNRYVTKPRPAPWRDRVLALVLQGHRRRRIAAELGIKPKHAANHMLKLYRLHGVRSRQALLARFGINFRGTPRGDPPTPDTAGQFLPRQLARVASLLKRGMSDQQIAAEMRLSVPTIMDYRCALYRVYAVHSRRNLIANLRTGAARHRAKLTA